MLHIALERRLNATTKAREVVGDAEEGVASPRRHRLGEWLSQIVTREWHPQPRRHVSERARTQKEVADGWATPISDLSAAETFVGGPQSFRAKDRRCDGTLRRVAVRQAEAV